MFLSNGIQCFRHIFNITLKYFYITFSYETQVALVRNAWSDIFVLGMAQCAQTMNLQNILSSIVSHLQTSVSQDKLSATRVRQVTTTICKIQEYVRALNKLNVDDWEFAYLKSISLFGAGNIFFMCQYKITNLIFQLFFDMLNYKMIFLLCI